MWKGEREERREEKEGGGEKRVIRCMTCSLYIHSKNMHNMLKSLGNGDKSPLILEVDFLSMRELK